MIRPQLGEPRRAIAHWGFYGLGCLGLTLSIVHLLTEGESLGTVLEAFIIGTIATMLFYTGWEANSRATSPTRVIRAVSISGGTGAAFATLAVGILLIWKLEGHGASDSEFIVSFASVLGLAVGGRSGLYAMQTNEEIAHSRELVKLLTINQRVLRHNLRNELAIVSGHLDHLTEQVGTDDSDITTAKHHVERLLTTSDRARRLVRIGQDPVRVEQDIETVLTDAFEAFHDRYPEVDVAVEVIASGTVLAHPALADALKEALTNAIEHNDPGIDITVSVAAPTESDLLVEIVDTGDGIPPREREVLTQTEETPLAHGVGLGLWLIYWTVEQSGGTLTLESNDPTGTVLKVRLPRAQNPSALPNSLLP